MANSDSESSQKSSENSSLSNYDEEVEYMDISGPTTTSKTNHFSDPDWVEPYADEPLADEEWLRNYLAKKVSDQKRYHEFEQRLKLAISLDQW
eukprot:gene7280-biopygen641